MKIEEEARELGADIFGVADLRQLRDHQTYPKNLLEGFTRGVSIGIKLGDEVLDGLPDTLPLYADCYRIANDKLDQITFELTRFINRKGYSALAIPASKVLDDTYWMSFISHKAVARAAGIGWIGKSLLLINQRYGPRIRIATVLTNMPLEVGEPVGRRCGECTDCIENCMVGAFKDSDFQDYPKSREEVFDIDGCAKKLKELADNPDIGYMVCGICVKVCPWGRK